MAVSEARFREQLRTLSRTEVAALLVDLWNARGWEADRTEAGTVRRTRQPGAPTETVFLLLDGDDTEPGPDADVVVDVAGSGWSARPDGVTVLDPTDVYQQIRFAVDRDVSEDLLATHLDMTTASSDTGEAAGSDKRGEDDRHGEDDEHAEGDQDAGKTPLRAEPAAQTGSATRPSTWTDTESDGSTPRPDSHSAEYRDTTGTGTSGSESIESTAGGGRGTDDTGSGGDDGGRRGRFARPNRRTVLIAGGALLAGAGTVVGTQLPREEDPSITVPGLDESGVTHAEALATAHVAAIEDSSYTLTLDRFGHRADRTLHSYLSMDLRLADDRSYLAYVATNGPEAPGFLGSPPVDGVFWSDGEVYLARTASGGEATYSSFEPPRGYVGTWRYWAKTIPFGGTYGSRPERYIQSVFDAIPTRLVDRRDTDAGTRYHVVTDGSKSVDSTELGVEVGATDLQDPRVDAHVDEDGVVRSLTVQYSAVLDGERIERFQSNDYSKIGETGVEQPDWADRVVY